MDNSKIALLIKTRREDLGMSQRRLATLIGVSNSTVSRWESGDISDLRKANAKLLSIYLYVPEDALMGTIDYEADKPSEVLRLKSQINIALSKINDIETLRTIKKMIKALQEEDE